METEEFIKNQIKMLAQGFEKRQIKDNVFRFVFIKAIPNLNINFQIFNCMELYSQIINSNLEEEIQMYVDNEGNNRC